MNMMTTIVRRPERLTALAELLRRFERDDMERAVDLLIAVLDAADGDPEAEAIDEREPAPEMLGDPSWIEWYQRGRHKLDRYGSEVLARDRTGNSLREDAEDDDPREDDGEDCCRAFEDDASRFSEGHTIGGGWDNAWCCEDNEYAGDEAEPVTWPEHEERQPSMMSGGLAGWDEYEPRHVPLTLNHDAANQS